MPEFVTNSTREAIVAHRNKTIGFTEGQSHDKQIGYAFGYTGGQTKLMCVDSFENENSGGLHKTSYQFHRPCLRLWKNLDFN